MKYNKINYNLYNFINITKKNKIFSNIISNTLFIKRPFKLKRFKKEIMSKKIKYLRILNLK